MLWGGMGKQTCYLIALLRKAQEKDSTLIRRGETPKGVSGRQFLVRAK